MSVLINDRMLLCAKGCGRFAQNAVCAVCTQKEVDQLSAHLAANHAKVFTDPRDARIAELEAALRATLNAIEVIDFSPIDGAYDSIPWLQIESALNSNVNSDKETE